MITGFVNRPWAAHHYRRWYKQNFPATARPAGEVISQGDAANRIDTAVTKLKGPDSRLRCPRKTTSAR